MVSPTAIRFYIPDLLRDWPWKRQINPHYAEVKEASVEWLESLHAFGPKSQRSCNVCEFSFLAALAYPQAEKAHLRTACDLMNVLFAFDEFSDVADEETTQAFADIMLDALHNPHDPRPTGESVLGELTQQFWELAIKTASESSQRRFIKVFHALTRAVVEQARDRDRNCARDVASYFEFRRDNIGARPSFSMLELALDLPDEVVEHPTVVALRDQCIDMLILSNDIYSYNVEQARGDDAHNLVTIAMREFGLDLPGAVAWVGREHDARVDAFLAGYKRLPSWGPAVDAQLARYVDGLGNWVRASDSWSFESERYFGSCGPAIQRDRWVAVLPPGGSYARDAPRAAVDQRGSGVDLVGPGPMTVILRQVEVAG